MTSAFAETAVVPRQEPVTAPVPAPVPAAGGGKGAARGGPLALIGGARRNLVAAGAGVLLAGVLGTVVTLGLTSSSDPQGGAGTSTEQEVPDDDGIYDEELETGSRRTGRPRPGRLPSPRPPRPR